jgi:hypothetical protein
MYRFVIKTGPLSDIAPWAKAAGACLNLDCSLILLPVIKMILSKLNNAGVNASRYSKSSNIVTQFFSRPITRYIPLQKNIEFHKMCAHAVFFFAWLHTVCHCLNLMQSSGTTLNNFAWLGWKGTGTCCYLPACLSHTVCPSVRLSVRLSLYLSVCPSVSLSIYLSVSHCLLAYLIHRFREWCGD